MKLDFEKEIVNQVCETSLPFHKLNNKKIIVTGCNGFIPSAFIKILNKIMDIHGYKIQFYGIARKKSNNRSNILQSLIKTKKFGSNGRHWFSLKIFHQIPKWYTKKMVGLAGMILSDCGITGLALL